MDTETTGIQYDKNDASDRYNAARRVAEIRDTALIQHDMNRVSGLAVAAATIAIREVAGDAGITIDAAMIPITAHDKATDAALQAAWEAAWDTAWEVAIDAYPALAEVVSVEVFEEAKSHDN